MVGGKGAVPFPGPTTGSGGRVGEFAGIVPGGFPPSPGTVSSLIAPEQPTASSSVEPPRSPRTESTETFAMRTGWAAGSRTHVVRVLKEPDEGTAKRTC